jgi:hypothetical protein
MKNLLALAILATLFVVFGASIGALIVVGAHP